MTRRIVFVALALAALACGIKAPPRPPLDELHPVDVKPDGGCCGARP